MIQMDWWIVTTLLKTKTDLNVMFLVESASIYSGARAYIISRLYFLDVYLRSESENSGAVVDIAPRLFVNVYLELVRSAASQSTLPTRPRSGSAWACPSPAHAGSAWALLGHAHAMLSW